MGTRQWLWKLDFFPTKRYDRQHLPGAGFGGESLGWVASGMRPTDDTYWSKRPTVVVSSCA
jgi:hypothetical protein